MSIEPGRSLLHYRVVEKLGEGGMGVVWRAFDGTLEREVAIKVLPEAVAADPERLARFEREAKLLASLNHPNIAAIYGLHRDGATHFLVMELVEGEDLAERLARGPLPIDEALDVARQTAAALEAAHERGVVHRDLKPANVKRTPEGAVKVLDFGLAKAMTPDAASGGADLSLSPTLTSAGTRAGMILGTAAYMSPEQARGRPLDRRTDLWSFGCLVYECLTGEKLFHGETVSDSLAAILRKEPEWSALPEGTPPGVRVLLRRCLARDARKRLQDAGDARVELEQAIEDPLGEWPGLAAGAGPVPRRRGIRALAPWAIAATALAIAVVLALRGGAPRPADERGARRLTIPVPGATEFGDDQSSPPAISPDGRTVVFGVADTRGGTQLWVRPLDDFTARPLDGTERGRFAFWSADSRSVGFFVGGRIRRTEIATGRVQTVGGEGSSYPRGGSWNADGKILFAPNSNTGIHLIDAAGGAVRQITTLDPDVPDHSHRWPAFLPDGEHFLFVSWTNDLEALDRFGGVFVASVDGDEAPVRVVPDASSVAYAPPGYLLVVRDDNLIAIPFDADSRTVTGEAKVIAAGVLRNRSNGHAAFSVSAEGTLVFVGGEAFAPSHLTWFDRAGNESACPIEAAPFSQLRLSPDAKRAAVVIPGSNGDGQIWTIDLARGVRTLLVAGLGTFSDPVWSGDGERILYASQERGSMDLYVRRADGSGEAQDVLVDGQDKILYDWSRDGKTIAYWPFGAGSGTPDLWVHAVDRKQSATLMDGDPAFLDARFSADGRWLAYASDVSGRREVFVQAFAGDDRLRGGARWQLSTAGGESPHWRDDGREIVYVDPERRLMAVSIEARGNDLVLGTPRVLFEIADVLVSYDATGDHQRFLVATRDATGTEPIHVVLDWPADL